MNKKMESVPVPSQSMLLHMAVSENKEQAVKFLLKHGANPNTRVTKQPLEKFICDIHNESDMRDILYCYRTSSFNACTFSPNPVTLDHRNINYAVSTRNRRIFSGSTFSDCKCWQKNPTPMHIAAANGKLAIIQLLLDHGADVNATMEGGFTPLIIAILTKNFELADLFIRRGADVNVRSKDGKTPMYFAVKSRQIELVKLLLRNGGDINARTDHGVTPLHIAVERKLLDVTELLLLNGSDVNAKTKTGVTPLHCAAVKGQHEITKMILRNGGDVSVIMKNGEIDVTPLLWVSESECRKTKDIIDEYTSSNINTGCFYNKFIKRIWRQIFGKKY